ncbi:MAG TPA: cupredoxin domain-containing protein [Crinalium sp.]|jgi:plastocyanin
MKYLTYFFTAIASTFLMILLSLSSCTPTSQTQIGQPSVIEPSTDQPQTPVHQTPTQPIENSQFVTATVKIYNFKFEPASVTITKGETVQFINLDEEPHTATSTDGIFNSRALDTNERWNYTATQPGTFAYICSIHPFMKGTITVTP